MKMHSLLCPMLALAAGTLAVAPLQAQAVAGDAGQTIRLSPEQIAKLRDSGTESSAAAAAGELTGGGMGRGIHGEFGVTVGTHGTRGAYGVAAIPLGENAGAVVSFENSRFGRR
jgi:hypothetical protein